MNAIAEIALSADAIHAGLPMSLRTQLASIQVAERTISTQADALAAPPPLQGCALFLAEHQTGGQGTQGRAWISAPAEASLALSIARRFPLATPMLSGLSLVTGIAVAEALGDERIGLKWPNDLLAGGRKLGGILVNLRAAPDSHCEAVVGIGLNLRLPAQSAIRSEERRVGKECRL